VLVYAAVLAYAVGRATEVAGLLLVIAGFGAAGFVFALVRGVPLLIAWTLVPLAAAYAVALEVHGRSVDDAAPLVAVALLLCGELAAWSLDERWAIKAERAVVSRRALALGALALAGLAASALVVGMAAAPAGEGLAWTTLGAAAAVGVVGAAAAVVRRAAGGRASLH
jgi:hypothetical protein